MKTSQDRRTALHQATGEELLVLAILGRANVTRVM